MDGKVIGFLAYELNLGKKTGEVLLLAVLPEYQNLAIGTELNLIALQKMETAGYTGLPIVRYYKDL